MGIQERRLGRMLKILSGALEHGGWTRDELARLMRRIKPDFDAAYEDVNAPESFEPDGYPNPIRPWDRTVDRLATLAARVEAPEPEAVLCGRSWGVEASLPVGDRR